MLGGAPGALAGDFRIVPRLGSELVPQLSQGEYNIDLRLPAGTPLEQTDRVVESRSVAAMQIGGVDLSYAVAGTGNRLDANPVDAGENTGKLSITLVPGAAALRRALRSQPATALDADAGLQYQFSRPSLFALSDTARGRGDAATTWTGSRRR